MSSAMNVKSFLILRLSQLFPGIVIQVKAIVEVHKWTPFQFFIYYIINP